MVDVKSNLSEQITLLLKKNNEQELSSFLSEQYPQDIADTISNLKKEEEKLKCFNLLDIENAGKVLSELNIENQKIIIENTTSSRLAQIITQMDVDDATDLIIRLPEDEKTALLKVLPDPVQQAQVQELIHYSPESAGGTMSTNFLRLRSDMTIHLAFNYVRRQAAEYKTQIYYLYVVDNTNKLVGVVTLKDLISSPLNDLVADHMNTEIITCNVNDDQEGVAKKISKYDLIAIPILDETNTLKGIVTVDDVVDILAKENTEDIFHVSGISDKFQSDELISGNVVYAVRARLPWLIITLFGQSLAALLLASFNNTISSVPIAVSFMPLLSGLSGNIGGQTATIIVRGLVTGDIQIKNTLKYLLHELKIGILLGITCALITGLIAWSFHGMPTLGLVVAFALTCSMILGVTLGTLLPILLQSFKKDPATATSPLITTMLDITTFTFYLSIISSVMKHLR